MPQTNGDSGMSPARTATTRRTGTASARSLAPLTGCGGDGPDGDAEGCFALAPAALAPAAFASAASAPAS